MIKINNFKNSFRKSLMESTLCYSPFIFNAPSTSWKMFLKNYAGNFKHRLRTKKCIRASISILLIACQFYTPAFAKPPKYYRFTPDIYEQEEKISSLTRSNPNISDKEIDKELSDELLRRKEEQLEENCLKKIKKDIEFLKEQFSHAKDIELKEKLLSISSAIATAVPVTVSFFTGGVSGFAVAPVVAAVAKIGEDFISNKILHQTALDYVPIQTIVREMRELEKEYKNLKDGLKYEPLMDLEKRYIEQKRHIKNPSLEAEIERSLIQARVADYYFQMNIPAIDYALGLPLKQKSLLDKDDRYNSQNDLIERFDNDKAFSIYSKDIQKSLRDTILRIACNSITTTSESPLRVIEHWLGTGSTGKSTAAKEIARFLGLPYFEKRITNPGAEINVASIFGAQRSFQGTAQLGWLAEALLQRTEGRGNESYQNAILILDDFPVNDPNGQSLLLTITDPGKRNLYNEFLQGNLDISRLNKIIISNDKFKSLKSREELEESKGIDPTFEALTSRFRTIVFSEFTEEQKGALLKTYLEKTLVNKYKPPFFYNFHYKDSTHFQITFDPEALAAMGLPLPDPIIIDTGINRPTAKMDSLLLPPSIKSEDKDKKNAFQKRKDEHDQQRLERYIDLQSEDHDSLLSAFHQERIVEILDEQEDRLLADHLSRNRPTAKGDSSLMPPSIDHFNSSNDYLVSGKKTNQDFHSSSPTVRELKELLEVRMNSYLTELIGSMCHNDTLEEAALKGKPEAITALVKKKIDASTDDIEKKALMRRLGDGHEKSGNINEAKKCWIDSFLFKDWEVWHQVSKYLPKKIDHELDKKLLDSLLKLLKNQTEYLGFDEAIGVHLYETWVQSKNGILENDFLNNCLKYSAALGNRNALKEIDNFNLNIFSKENNICLKDIGRIINNKPLLYSKTFKILSDMYRQGELIGLTHVMGWAYGEKARMHNDSSFSYDDPMHFLSIELNNNNVFVGKFNDRNLLGITDWTNFERRNNLPNPISTVFFEGKSYVATIKGQNLLITCSINNKNWEYPRSILLRHPAKGGSSLTSFKDRLYFTYIGKDKKIWLSSSKDGEMWEPAYNPNENWKACEAISLTSFRGKLYLANIRDTIFNKNTYLSSSEDGKQWTEGINIMKGFQDGDFAKKALCLTSLKTKLYLGYIDWSSKIWITSSTDGKIWKEPIAVGKTADSMSLSASAEKIFLSYQNNRGNWITTSINGESWLRPNKIDRNNGRICLAPLLEVTEVSQNP